MKILIFTSISELGTTLPKEVGETNKLQTEQFCSQKIHRCILRGLGYTLQHPYDDCGCCKGNGYKDIVRETDHQEHLGSLGLRNQHLLLPASGRRGGKMGHQPGARAFLPHQPKFPPCKHMARHSSIYTHSVRPGPLHFFYANYKRKAYLYTSHQ